jgi:hypothetical protein
MTHERDRLAAADLQVNAAAIPFASSGVDADPSSGGPPGRWAEHLRIELAAAQDRVATFLPLTRWTKAHSQIFSPSAAAFAVSNVEARR